MFENLEQRRLMAIFPIIPSPLLDDGVLRIDATTGDDLIEVTREKNLLIASLTWETGGAQPQKSIYLFDLADVRRIVVKGNGGDDRIDIDGQLTIAARVSGGAGNDTIAGGKGDDTLRGGRGDDVIIGRYGDDIIYGNAGDDRINGRNGNDHINAGAGDDRIRDLRGQNAVHGGSGEDQARLDSGALPIGSGVEDWLWGGSHPGAIFQSVDPKDAGAILYWEDGRLIIEFNRGANGDAYTFSRLQRRDDGVFEVIVTHHRGDFGLGPEHFAHRWDVTAAVGSGLVFITNTPSNLSPGPVQSTVLFRPDEAGLGVQPDALTIFLNV